MYLLSLSFECLGLATPCHINTHVYKCLECVYIGYDESLLLEGGMYFALSPRASRRCFASTRAAEVMLFRKKRLVSLLMSGRRYGERTNLLSGLKYIMTDPKRREPPIPYIQISSQSSRRRFIPGCLTCSDGGQSKSQK